MRRVRLTNSSFFLLNIINVLISSYPVIISCETSEAKEVCNLRSVPLRFVALSNFLVYWLCICIKRTEEILLSEHE